MAIQILQLIMLWHMMKELLGRVGPKMTAVQKFADEYNCFLQDTNFENI